MKISYYSYNLPEELIAKFPQTRRGKSRLLALTRENGIISHRRYNDLVDYIEAGDVVVLNDTKVIKARLIATNNKGKKLDLLLLEEHAGGDPFKRRILYKGKLSPGEILHIGKAKVTVDTIVNGGIATISSSTNLLSLAETTGSVPLPPYMHRGATDEDIERYQTVFARRPGSVAAPTASLNFTRGLEAKILAKGAKIAYLTLHVGLGTFLPIRADDIEDHAMHSEYFEMPEATVMAIQVAKKSGRKILAIGTTVARTLEYVSQNLQFFDLLEVRLPINNEKILCGEADIFIYPGYEFKLVDMLLTNFHAPKTTVLMLTAAFAGWDKLKPAYQEAIKEKYAFLSYGDSMLIY